MSSQIVHNLSFSYSSLLLFAIAFVEKEYFCFENFKIAFRSIIRNSSGNIRLEILNSLNYVILIGV